MSRRRLKQPVTLFIITILLSPIAISLFTTHFAAAQAATDKNEYYTKSYAWDYEGKHWTWNLSIPKALYEAYEAVPDYSRTRQGPAGYGFLTTTQDYYIRVLAQKLNETTTNLQYNSYDQVSFILAFVQSLPYTSDNVTTGYDEYPRFPIETLVDDGGDCEDTSILFATLTLILGYGTVYINPPNHYAVGILGNNLHGTYWEYPQDSNKTYYYSETTGNGFKIGQLPDEFSGLAANIYSIDQSRQFVPNVILDPTLETTPEPTESAYVMTTSPTPTVEPNPIGTTSPEIPQPSEQQAHPLSFNLISESPLLFGVILFAVVASIGVAVWSVRRNRETPLSPEAVPGENTAGVEGNEAEADKFCIFCGSNNKGFAAFCEKCGKQIGES